jgi:ABC-type Zn uptake system ZnuABC Zn-binding protein ZnuA
MGAEPSAQAVAAVINQIKTEKIRAVFLENISDGRLLQRISQEGGARIGGVLYSDALSEANAPAATYLDLMRNNLIELVKETFKKVQATRAQDSEQARCLQRSKTTADWVAKDPLE